MVQCHHWFWCFLSFLIIPFIIFWCFLIICAINLLSPSSKLCSAEIEILQMTLLCQWATWETSSIAGSWKEMTRWVEGEVSCSSTCYSYQQDPKGALQPNCRSWFQFLTSLPTPRTSLLILPWKNKQWLNDDPSSEDWDPAPLETLLQTPAVVGATRMPPPQKSKSQLSGVLPLFLSSANVPVFSWFPQGWSL